MKGVPPVTSLDLSPSIAFKKFLSFGQSIRHDPNSVFAKFKTRTVIQKDNSVFVIDRNSLFLL